MDLIFEQYAEKLRRKGKSPHSIRGFLDAARPLSRWLAEQGVPAEASSFELLDEYFDTLPLAASSRATHMRYIKASFNYAARLGRITHNPTEHLEEPKPDPKQPRIISGQCLRTIRERIMWDHDWLFYHLLTYSGLRRAEIRNLIWDDGSDDRSVVKLPEQTLFVIGKGGKPRVVPIHPALGEALVDAQGKPSARAGGAVVTANGGKHLAEDTIQSISKRLSPVYTPHDYRRTVATSLRRNGVDSGVIDRILGWAPASIFRRYYDNVADIELHRAILKLYADDPV